MITAQIIVTPKRSVLDPQGEAVRRAIHSLGLAGVTSARVGKFIELEIEATSTALVQEKLETISHDLLSNPVVEDYRLMLLSPARKTKLATSDYAGLDDAAAHSEDDLIQLETKPKKAIKKIARIEKKMVRENFKKVEKPKIEKKKAKKSGKSSAE